MGRLKELRKYVDNELEQMSEHLAAATRDGTFTRWNCAVAGTHMNGDRRVAGPHLAAADYYRLFS